MRKYLKSTKQSLRMRRRLSYTGLRQDGISQREFNRQVEKHLHQNSYTIFFIIVSVITITTYAINYRMEGTYNGY